MIRWRKRIRRLSYLLTDLICLLMSLILTLHILQNLLQRHMTLSSLEMTGLVMLLIMINFTVFLVSSLYEVLMQERSVFTLKVTVRLFIANGLSFLISSASLFLMKVDLSRLFLIMFTGLFFLMSFVAKLVLKRLQRIDPNGTSHSRNILVIGQSEKGVQYIEQIRNHCYLDLNIIGYVHIKRPHAYPDVQHLGGIDELESILKNYVVDEIAVTRPLSYDDRLQTTLNRCQEMGITISMLLDTHNYVYTKAQVAMVGNIPVLKFHTVSLNENQITLKRVLDVLGGMFGMFIFVVAYIFIGPLIKMESPGPVIFKQKRVGKNGRIFEIWKFRSMGVNAEAQKLTLLGSNEMSGFMFKMTHDPRVTKIGKFIRKTSIDELPQFWNVLKGDMSLVGTRPPTVDEVEKYEAHHHRRISITPGITGNWQISGRSDVENFEDVVRLDTDYISNWTIWQDIRILFKTVYVVFEGKGSK